MGAVQPTWRSSPKFTDTNVPAALAASDATAPCGITEAHLDSKQWTVDSGQLTVNREQWSSDKVTSEQLDGETWLTD